MHCIMNKTFGINARKRRVNVKTVLCSSASLPFMQVIYLRKTRTKCKKPQSDKNHATLDDLTEEFAISSSLHTANTRIK